jgi:hypothetical protein
MRTPILLICIVFAIIVNAKDAINYQAIVKSTDGKVVVSKNIAVKITIFNDTQTRQTVYQETHSTVTNALGMINLKIGLGQVLNGVFDNINWGVGKFFVQVAADFAGGTNFQVIGTTQVLAVPTALYAKQSAEINVSELSDDFIKDLNAKLDLSTKPTVLTAKVANTDYSATDETKDIVVYQSKSAFSIESVLGKVIVKKTSPTQFKFGENGIDGTFDTSVNIDINTFPHLLSGSTIERIMLLPWERNTTTPVPSKGWRCCLITNKGQVYHNFPNRTPASGQPDGIAMAGDINKWDESVIWDLSTRRLPSKTSDVFPYSLNPCLPESCYEIYPTIKNDNGYGNGGFDIITTQKVGVKTVQFPRFYCHSRELEKSPVSFKGRFEASNKIQIIGTYMLNTSFETTGRVCIFASTDGGRQWYNKFEFANDMPNAVGNALIGKNIVDEYVPNSLILQKRDFVFPNETVKDPVNLFTYGSDINIETIVKSDSIVINTLVPHNLKTGDLIAIKKAVTSGTSNYDFLCNNNINVKTGGNGKIWRVSVIGPTSIKLFEYIHNPDSNLPARHIHAINYIKDGFLISTGSMYPQGWITYLQIKASDTYSTVNASDNFSFIRLNSTQNSVQNSMGTLMMDDVDQTIVYAADKESKQENIQNIIGKTSNSNYGVYKGKLADIDDSSKFNCIYSAEQEPYHFKDVNGLWIYAGQQGELAISVDKGNTWRKFSVNASTELTHLYSKGTDILQRYYLDKVIIYRK